MTRRMICGGIAVTALMMTVPASIEAATPFARAHFSFDALATCQQPAVTDFPVHAEGTGVLSTDKTATLDMESNIEGKVRYNSKLGAKAEKVPGGSASLRVAGRHTLRVVREYPNNSIIVYITVIGNACTMKIENRLKRGKSQYTFYGNAGVAYCSQPRIVKTECTPY